jgi:hypothetical protein
MSYIPMRARRVWLILPFVGILGCGDSTERVEQSGKSSSARPTTAPAGPGGAADPMLSSDTQRTLMLLEEKKAGPGPQRPVSPAYDRQRGPAGIETQPRGNVAPR